MTLYYGVLLAFVQAVTEFLPVSSSGHLLFCKSIFHFQEVPLVYDVLMHVGSLVAVVFFYRLKIINTFRSAWFENRLYQKKKPNSRFLIYVCISTVVTFIGFLIFKDKIEAKFETPDILFKTYLITTIILFSTVFSRKGQAQPVAMKPWYIAVVIGLFQAFALLPGISRSGSTIAVMLLLGIDRAECAYYSFMLFIPAVLGALVFQLSDLANVYYIQSHIVPLTLSFIAAVGFSYLFLFLLNWIVKKGRLWVFGFYTCLLAVIALKLF